MTDQVNSSSSPAEQENPATHPISFFSLFRFASCIDRFLIILGVMASSATGFLFPVVTIIFGDLTDAFVGGGLDPQTLRNITCNTSIPSNAR